MILSPSLHISANMHEWHRRTLRNSSQFLFGDGNLHGRDSCLMADNSALLFASACAITCMLCMCHSGMNTSDVKCIEATSGTLGGGLDNTAHELCSTHLSISSQRRMLRKNSSSSRLCRDSRFRLTFGPVSRSKVWLNGGSDLARVDPRGCR